jgi:hypothetical protein
VYCFPAPVTKSPMKLYRAIDFRRWITGIFSLSTSFLLMSGVEHPVSKRAYMVRFDCVPQWMTILTIGRSPQNGLVLVNLGEAFIGVSFLRCLSCDDFLSSGPFRLSEVPQMIV